MIDYLKIFLSCFFPIVTFLNIEAVSIFLTALFSSSQTSSVHRIVFFVVPTIIAVFILLISGFFIAYIVLVCIDEHPIQQGTFDESQIDVMAKLIVKVIVVQIRVFKPSSTLKALFIIGSTIICLLVLVHQLWRPLKSRSLEWIGLTAKTILIDIQFSIFLVEKFTVSQNILFALCQHVFGLVLVVYIMLNIKSRRCIPSLPTLNKASNNPLMLVTMRDYLSIIQYGSIEHRIFLTALMEKELKSPEKTGSQEHDLMLKKTFFEPVEICEIMQQNRMNFEEILVKNFIHLLIRYISRVLERQTIIDHDLLNFLIKLIYFKTDAKVTALLLFVNFKLTRSWQSFYERKKNYLLRKSFENQIDLEHFSLSMIQDKDRTKSITHSELCAELQDEIIQMIDFLIDFWLKISDLEIHIDEIKGFFKQIYQEKCKVLVLWEKTVKLGKPTHNTIDLFMNWLKIVACDFERFDHEKNRFEKVIEDKYRTLESIDLKIPQATAHAIKTFCLISSNPSMKGRITYISQNLKEILGLSQSDKIIPAMDQIKPVFFIDVYKQWIDEFCEDHHLYNSLIKDEQFFDFFLDRDGFVLTFLANIKVCPNLNGQIEFLLYLTPVTMSEHEKPVMLFESQSRNLLAVNSKAASEFGIYPEQLHEEFRNGTNLFNFENLFLNGDSINENFFQMEGGKMQLFFAGLKNIYDSNNKYRQSPTLGLKIPADLSMESRGSISMSQDVTHRLSICTDRESMRQSWHQSFLVDMEVVKVCSTNHCSIVFIKFDKTSELDDNSRFVKPNKGEKCLRQSMFTSAALEKNSSLLKDSRNPNAHKRHMLVPGCTGLLVIAQTVVIIACFFVIMSLKGISVDISMLCANQASKSQFLADIFVIGMTGQSNAKTITESSKSIYTTRIKQAFKLMAKSQHSMLELVLKYVDNNDQQQIVGSNSLLVNDTLQLIQQPNQINITSHGLNISMSENIYLESQVYTVTQFIQTLNSTTFREIDSTMSRSINQEMKLFTNYYRFPQERFDTFTSVLQGLNVGVIIIFFFQSLVLLIMRRSLAKTDSNIYSKFLEFGAPHANKFLSKLIKLKKTFSSETDSALLPKQRRTKKNLDYSQEDQALMDKLQDHTFADIRLENHLYNKQSRSLKNMSNHTLKSLAHNNENNAEFMTQLDTIKQNLTKIKKEVIDFFDNYMVLITSILVLLLLWIVNQSVVYNSSILRDASISLKSLREAYNYNVLLKMKQIYGLQCHNCTAISTNLTNQITDYFLNFSSLTKSGPEEFEPLKSFMTKIDLDFCTNYVNQSPKTPTSYPTVCKDYSILQKGLKVALVTINKELFDVFNSESLNTLQFKLILRNGMSVIEDFFSDTANIVIETNIRWWDFILSRIYLSFWLFAGLNLLSYAGYLIRYLMIHKVKTAIRKQVESFVMASSSIGKVNKIYLQTN